jgi:cellulose biosynthesis protein BcsQ
MAGTSDSHGRSFKTEIVSVVSGKGGAGKTILAATLAFALRVSGHRVLLIDADRGTEGLSLFLLGPTGLEEIQKIPVSQTLYGLIQEYEDRRRIDVQAYRLNRRDHKLPLPHVEHGVFYEAIITGPGLYGEPSDVATPYVPSEIFCEVMAAIFERVRASGEYDYVIVDTRGGFASESTQIAALSDSYIAVTEPDYTSFHQNRNFRQIEAHSRVLEFQARLRGVIINKARELAGVPSTVRTAGQDLDLDRLEFEMRNALEKEFSEDWGLTYRRTYPVPLDFEVLRSYRTQNLPLVTAPASTYSYAVFVAFSSLFELVTTQWDDERIERWNALVNFIDREMGAKNERLRNEEREATDFRERYTELEISNRHLEERLKERVAEDQKREASPVVITTASPGRETERGWASMALMMVMLVIVMVFAMTVVFREFESQRGQADVQMELRAAIANQSAQIDDIRRALMELSKGSQKQ